MGPHRLRTATVTARASFLVLLAAAFLLASFGVSYSADIPIATVAVGNAPRAVATDVISDAVYVTNYYGDSISVIDGVPPFPVLGTVSMPTTFAIGAAPIAVVTDPTRGLAYVANWQSGIVAMVSGPPYVVSRSVYVPTIRGGYPRALALDPSSTPPKLYVANYGEECVSVLDALTLGTITEIPVGLQPRAMAIFTSAGRRRVFVGNGGSNSVTIIDEATDSVVGTVPLDGAPSAIAVNGAGGKAYVTVGGTDKVVVIGTSDTVVATITVGDAPAGIDFRSATRGLVACTNSDDVYAIAADTDSVVTSVPVGPGPFNVTAAPLDAKWFVTDRDGSTVNAVSDAYAVTTVTVGGEPFQVAVNENTTPHYAYCSNFDSDTVTVIDEPLPVAAGTPALAVAYAAGPADAPRLTVAIDPLPGDATASPTPVFTGSVTGTTSPYEFAIQAVWYRLDAEAGWRRADITDGAGTAAVRWRAECPELSAGPHTITVMAMDEGMLAVASAPSDGGAAGADVEEPSAYAFGVGYPETWVEQSDAALVWTGAWSTVLRSQLYGGSARYASGASRSVSVPFEGTSIDWIGAKTTSGGIAHVYVDGMWAGSVDQYARLNVLRQTLFASGALPPGPHTLRIESSNARNRYSLGYTTWVDAFRITGTLAP